MESPAPPTAPSRPAPSRFAIRRPEVVSEVFDAEAVVVDLVAGRYYAFNAAATAIWSLLARRPTLDEAVAALAPAFGDEGRAHAEVAGFLDRLLETGMVVRVAGDDGPLADAVAAAPAAGAGVELPPADFEVFTDLEDLLVLDPIHDLDESGWPRPPAAAVEPGG